MQHALATLVSTLWLVATAGPPPAADLPAVAPAPEPAAAVLVVAEADPPAPAASCLDVAIDAIQTRYEKVEDLEARFVQTSRPAHLGSIAPDPVVSQGSVVVAKPGKMRWNYETPEQSLVVSDGESLWIYDPGFGEAQKIPVTEGYLSGAAVQFLLGEGNMRRDFDITVVSCDEERAELALVPKEPASYAKLRVVTNPRSGDLSGTVVEDLLGNVTEVEFQDLRVNRKPAASTFTFTAPDGVKVIELAPVP